MIATDIFDFLSIIFQADLHIAEQVQLGAPVEAAGLADTPGNRHLIEAQIRIALAGITGIEAELIFPSRHFPQVKIAVRRVILIIQRDRLEGIEQAPYRLQGIGRFGAAFFLLGLLHRIFIFRFPALLPGPVLPPPPPGGGSGRLSAVTPRLIGIVDRFQQGRQLKVAADTVIDRQVGAARIDLRVIQRIDKIGGVAVVGAEPGEELGIISRREPLGDPGIGAEIPLADDRFQHILGPGVTGGIQAGIALVIAVIIEADAFGKFVAHRELAGIAHIDVGHRRFSDPGGLQVRLHPALAHVFVICQRKVHAGGVGRIIDFLAGQRSQQLALAHPGKRLDEVIPPKGDLVRKAPAQRGVVVQRIVGVEGLFFGIIHVHHDLINRILQQPGVAWFLAPLKRGADGARFGESDFPFQLWIDIGQAEEGFHPVAEAVDGVIGALVAVEEILWHIARPGQLGIDGNLESPAFRHKFVQTQAGKIGLFLLGLVLSVGAGKLLLHPAEVVIHQFPLGADAADIRHRQVGQQAHGGTALPLHPGNTHLVDPDLIIGKAIQQGTLLARIVGAEGDVIDIMQAGIAHHHKFALRLFGIAAVKHLQQRIRLRNIKDESGGIRRQREVLGIGQSRKIDLQLPPSRIDRLAVLVIDLVGWAKAHIKHHRILLPQAGPGLIAGIPVQEHFQAFIIEQVQLFPELFFRLHLGSHRELLQLHHQRLLLGYRLGDAVTNPLHIRGTAVVGRVAGMFLGVIHCDAEAAFAQFEPLIVFSLEADLFPVVADKIEGGDAHRIVTADGGLDIIHPDTNIENLLESGIGIADLELVLLDGNAVELPPGRGAVIKFGAAGQKGLIQGGVEIKGIAEIVVEGIDGAVAVEVFGIREASSFGVGVIFRAVDAQELRLGVAGIGPVVVAGIIRHIAVIAAPHPIDPGIFKIGVVQVEQTVVVAVFGVQIGIRFNQDTLIIRIGKAAAHPVIFAHLSDIDIDLPFFPFHPQLDKFGFLLIGKGGGAAHDACPGAVLADPVIAPAQGHHVGGGPGTGGHIPVRPDALGTDLVERVEPVENHPLEVFLQHIIAHRDRVWRSGAGTVADPWIGKTVKMRRHRRHAPDAVLDPQ